MRCVRCAGAGTLGCGAGGCCYGGGFVRVWMCVYGWDPPQNARESWRFGLTPRELPPVSRGAIHGPALPPAMSGVVAVIQQSGGWSFRTPVGYTPLPPRLSSRFLASGLRRRGVYCTTIVLPVRFICRGASPCGLSRKQLPSNTRSVCLFRVLYACPRLVTGASVPRPFVIRSIVSHDGGFVWF